MPRVCVINIAGLSRRLLADDGQLWINRLATPPRAMGATFPVVAASVQASMTTGTLPGAHGVIAGGIFRRQCRTFSLGERSNTLLNKKRFWYARDLPRRPRVALVFWSNPLAGAADLVIGANTYEPSETLIADLPVGLYAQAAARLGPPDVSTVRGPAASWHASRWIADAARWVWTTQAPDLLWVYLPGINFEMVRHGTESMQALVALRGIDSLAAELAAHVERTGGRTLVVSDGGYVDVHRVAYPNVALRKAGLLTVRQTPEGEVLDLESSRAFALADHQVAHLFCVDDAAAEEADAAVAQDPAVSRVTHRDEWFCAGLGHDRSGDRIVLAHRDAWLCYRWWADDEEAPALARQADAPGKCGYDPCELFAGDADGTIDPAPLRVRASRGLLTAPLADQCVLAATGPLDGPPDPCVTDVPALVTKLLFG